jgi:4-amino-4-deoxy-L-arabinose transferase-like glycosyltransferase
MNPEFPAGKPAASLSLLFAILLVAFLLRLFWIVRYTVVIENEGAEYARIAENLLNGNGYVGTMENPQLMYGPLYPILIAVVSLVSTNSETAGRIVSLVFGTSLVLTMFLIARHIYGQRTAFIAAGLVALHPLFVGFSASAYNETIYLAVMMVGVYWALRSLELEDFRHCLLAGILFGFAYLSRVEAIVYPFLTVSVFVAVAFFKKKELKRMILASLVLVAAFVALASPYIAFISLHTGGIRWEGKSRMNYTIGRRMSLGMNSNQAQYGIEENLAEVGPMLNPNRFASYSPYPASPKDLLHYFLEAARRNRVDLAQQVLSSFSFGSPLLLGLTLIGLVRTAWDRQRLIYEGFLLLLVLFILLLLLSAHYIQFRYTLSFLPFLVLWAAKGIEELSDWAMTSLANMGLSLSSVVARARIVFQCGVAALLLGMAAVGVFHFTVADFESSKSEVFPLKEAGLWLRKYKAGPKRIMDVGAVVPYYAEGFYVPLPDACSSRALQYIERKAPDFIVITDFSYHARPYLEEWFNKGIPDSRAQLIYDSGSSGVNQRIEIYRWLGAENATDGSRVVKNKYELASFFPMEKL